MHRHWMTVTLLANAGLFGSTVAPVRADFTFGNPAFSVGNHPVSLIAGDLDGDGDLDIATANSNNNYISVLLNEGEGTFADHALYDTGFEPVS